MVLGSIGENAVEAALRAAQEMKDQREAQRKTLVLEWEQSHYESKLAAQRYEAVDPENRLVAEELETRWNVAIKKEKAIENRIQDFDQPRKAQDSQ